MLGIAFKEWAAICEALASGRQALILRKGGIAEAEGEFRPDYQRFWLYPTYVHQQETGLKPTESHWLTLARQNRPPLGRIHLQAWCDVGPVRYFDQIEPLLALAEWHIWSETTVIQRFHYRRLGLFVLPVRVFVRAQSQDLLELPEYAGCKTWVEFPADSASELNEQPATPVLTQPAYEAVLHAVRQFG